MKKLSLFLLLVPISAFSAESRQGGDEFCKPLQNIQVPTHAQAANCGAPVINFVSGADSWLTNAKGQGNKRYSCRKFGSQFEALNQKLNLQVVDCNNSQHIQAGERGALLLRDIQAKEVRDSASNHLANCVEKLKSISQEAEEESLRTIDLPAGRRENNQRRTVKDTLAELEQIYKERMGPVSSAPGTPQCTSIVNSAKQTFEKIGVGYKGIGRQFAQLSLNAITQMKKFEIPLNTIRSMASPIPSPLPNQSSLPNR